MRENYKLVLEKNYNGLLVVEKEKITSNLISSVYVISHDAFKHLTDQLLDYFMGIANCSGNHKITFKVEVENVKDCKHQDAGVITITDDFHKD